MSTSNVPKNPKPLVPITRTVIVTALRKIGLCENDTVLVHTSLSKLGFICGGPETIILSLLDVLGPNGTLVMPAHTACNTDPKNWNNPPIAPESWETVRNETPPFLEYQTPTFKMGQTAELFRNWRGCLRSSHPVGSFAAFGPNAPEILKDHNFDGEIFGKNSPIEKLYNLGAKVLLLGVGFEKCTCLHLAEYRGQFSKIFVTEGSSVTLNGNKQWVNFEAQVLDTEDFEEIGRCFETISISSKNQLGKGIIRLIDIPNLVDFATSWMTHNRKYYI